MKKRNKIILGIGLAVVVVGLGAKFIFFDSVDACYDSGGVYLDEISKCSYSQTEVDHYRPSRVDRLESATHPLRTFDAPLLVRYGDEHFDAATWLRS